MRSLVSLSVVLTTCLSRLATVDRVDGENNDYSGDFSAHCGLIYMRDAAAVVEAIGPQVQTTGLMSRPCIKVMLLSVVWLWVQAR